MAPEVFSVRDHYQSYSPLKADIFSLGVVLFFMAFGQKLWNEPNSRVNLCFKILQEKGIETLFSKHPSTRGLPVEKVSSIMHLLD
jgi:serine/threonine protein kinase